MDQEDSEVEDWNLGRRGLWRSGSSFVVILLKNSRDKTGGNVQARVQIKMRPPSGEKDRNLLLSIQEIFRCAPYGAQGIGNIFKSNNASTVEFKINIQN